MFTEVEVPAQFFALKVTIYQVPRLDRIPQIFLITNEFHDFHSIFSVIFDFTCVLNESNLVSVMFMYEPQ